MLERDTAESTSKRWIARFGKASQQSDAGSSVLLLRGISDAFRECESSIQFEAQQLSPVSFCVCLKLL